MKCQRKIRGNLDGWEKTLSYRDVDTLQVTRVKTSWWAASVPLQQSPGFVQVWWSGTGQGGVGVWGLGLGMGGTDVPSPHVVPPPGVLTLILLHVSPISTNGAAIVPLLCAVVPSAQSPWVSKLSSVMFGLLPTHRGLHDDGGHPPAHRQSHPLTQCWGCWDGHRT